MSDDWTKSDPDPSAMTPDDAFTGAMAGPIFQGKQLARWTPQRTAAAFSLGLRFGSVPAEEIRTIQAEDDNGDRVEIQVYNDMFADVVMVLWLLHEEQIDYCFSDKARARSNMWAWAEKVGLQFGSDVYFEAVSVFTTIMDQIATSQTEPKKKPVASRPKRTRVKR